MRSVATHRSSRRACVGYLMRTIAPDCRASLVVTREGLVAACNAAFSWRGAVWSRLFTVLERPKLRPIGEVGVWMDVRFYAQSNMRFSEIAEHLHLRRRVIRVNTSGNLLRAAAPKARKSLLCGLD